MIASIDHIALPTPRSFTLKTFAALLIVAMGHPAVAQTTTAAAPPSSPVTSIRSDVRRVDVDVVVTDSKGHPVIGLTQQDFRVEEDRVPQTLRFLDVHTFAPDAGYVAPKIPPLPPNTFLNIRKAPESGTPTVILYDALNTPLTEQDSGHKQILDLLKHRRPGTQIAIFILTLKLHLLQGFTEDTDLLAAALDSKAGGPQTTTLLAPGNSVASTPGSDNPENTIQIQAPPGTPGGLKTEKTGDPDQAFKNFLIKVRDQDAADQEQLQDQRVELTLKALTEIGRFLAPMSGRKDLIWLSSAFPAQIFPDRTIAAPDPTKPHQSTRDEGVRNYSEQIKQATDLLNLSHVSVYPVDIRGIRVNSDLSAASNARFGSDPTFGRPSSSSLKQESSAQARDTSSTSLDLSQQNFVVEDEATRTTMDSIADDTGGHAFYGTNGLQEAVNSALTSGSTYYSLNYLPTNPKFDGSLRHIKVTLRRSGYNLSYRKAYYADDLSAAAQTVADAPQSPLTPALERGTPLSHDLFVEAHLDAAGQPVLATPAQMQVLAQYDAMQSTKKKAKTSPGQVPPVTMQQYFITYGLFVRQLQMPADDTGAHQASLELGIISYDNDGRKLNGLDTRIDDNIPAPRYAKVASDGYRVVQSIAVPVTAASIRLAVRDIQGNRIGSLEVQLPLTKTAEATPPQIKPPAK